MTDQDQRRYTIRGNLKGENSKCEKEDIKRLMNIQGNTLQENTTKKVIDVSVHMILDLTEFSIVAKFEHRQSI